MRVLDLFCGAGMAADGYAAAGFTPVGWDIKQRESYPYEFNRGDALEVLRDTAYLRTFDLIHASPPCQSHTRAKHLRDAQGGKAKFGDLLTPRWSCCVSAAFRGWWRMWSVRPAWRVQLWSAALRTG